MFGFKTVSIKPHHAGYLYKNNRLYKRLEPGRYRFWAGLSELSAIAIPTTERLVVITNQDVLTRDNIALRFSYVIRYAVNQSDRFVASFDVMQNSHAIFFELDQQLHHLSQAHLRQVIAQIDSEHLNDQRETLLAELPGAFVSHFASYGVELRGLILRDLTFPKAIQTLFSRRLEAKIRAQTDLENARTAVATARTLKNAAELMKGNDSIQFLQLLETLTKISASGQHTFVLGDLDCTRHT
jgi:regulator of protease activity HflC (stomatin/prohibitin superfamily)